MKKIIRRDYFPDNQKLEAQLAYIEASESNDPAKLREISERYATDLLQTPAGNNSYENIFIQQHFHTREHSTHYRVLVLVHAPCEWGL